MRINRIVKNLFCFILSAFIAIGAGAAYAAPAKDTLLDKDIQSGVLDSNLISMDQWVGHSNTNSVVSNAEAETGVANSIKISNINVSAGSTEGICALNEFDVSQYADTSGDFLLRFEMKTVAADKTAKFKLNTFLQERSGGSNITQFFKLYEFECNDTWQIFEFKWKHAFPETIASNVEMVFTLSAVNDENGSCADVYTADWAFCEYNNTDIMNVVVNENTVVNTITDKSLGYSLEFAQDILARQGVQDRKDLSIPQEFCDIVDSMPIKSLRIGGANYNYIQWKNDIGAYEDRVKYLPKVTEGAYDEWLKENANHFGIVEALKLINNGCVDTELIYNLNMYSAKPADAAELETSETAYCVEPVVTFSGETYTIDEAKLDQLITDTLDLVRFLSMDKENPYAVDENGFNWAAYREELGITKPVNVTHWELGNEFYLIENMTVDAYMALCNRFITAIKQIQPEAKFIAHGYSSDMSWNEAVISQLGDKISGFAWHEYYFYDDLNSMVLPNTEKLIKVIADYGYADSIKIYYTESGLNFNSHNLNGQDISGQENFGRGISYPAFLNHMLRYSEIDAIHCYLGNFMLTNYQNAATEYDDTRPKKRSIHHVLTEYLKYAKGDLYDTACSDDAVCATPLYTSPRAMHSAAAFKTPTGMRLFVSNTDTDKSYKLNLHSDKTYQLECRREYSCPDVFADVYTGDITDEVVYDDTLPTGDIIIPPNSLVVLEYSQNGLGAVVEGENIVVKGNAPSNAASVDVSIEAEGETAYVQTISVLEGLYSYSGPIDKHKAYTVSVKSGDELIYTAKLCRSSFNINLRNIRDDLYFINFNTNSSTLTDNKFVYIVKSVDDEENYNYQFEYINPDGGGNGMIKKELQNKSNLYFWDNLNSIKPFSPQFNIK